ncbi:hypothetical protein H6S82_17040 [Planktothrix sp. FACHB-1355]|uniref:Uncharacterized protein n=1 Tax=Aerosakkonema funiforme FACHB-1375 TaxID=2949571 RepID=A0A926V9E1_9CYAN|nr:MULTISPECIES: hypothetical protein [Oscillatoriales]MBD2179530.1 hypothetical protein [Aerosakkonema funiforme FACHB-1375]MBD3560544.1 hypothetical protein [Planktothrix sp. FACHB-1355]
MASTNSTNAIANFGTMLKKTYILGILTVSTAGILPFAAKATANPCCQPSGGDSAVVQTSTQQANVSGKGNSVNQNSNQSANASNPTVQPVRTGQKRPVRVRPVRRPVHRPVCNSTCK